MLMLSLENKDILLMLSLAKESLYILMLSLGNKDLYILMLSLGNKDLYINVKFKEQGSLN